MREAYLHATLKQDVEYFDEVGAGEVATRIQNDTRRSFDPPCRTITLLVIDLVQQGISEKVPLATQYLASFIAGIIIGYTTCWQLALAMSSILPCISITGTIMAKFMSRYSRCVLLSSKTNLLNFVY
jgi:ATP-binding cassette subfamily B (MDR/TAP) protein 1